MKIAVTNEKEPFGLTVSAGTYSPSYETLSGSIVTFDDAWVGSKIYPNANIVPVQSLNGYDKPYPPGGGKNKYPIACSEKTITKNGITAKRNANGSITLSGTASAELNIDLVGFEQGYGSNKLTLPAGSYRATATGLVSGVSLIYGGASNTSGLAYNTLTSTGSAKNLTLSSDGTTGYNTLQIANGTAITSAITITYQWEVGSTSTTYTPYSNICPITGFSSVDVSRCGNNLIKVTDDTIVNSQNSTSVITDSGITVTATGTYGRRMDSFKVIPGQTYTLSFTGSSNGGFDRVYICKAEGYAVGDQYRTFTLTSTPSDNSYTFTAETDTLALAWYVSATDTTGTMTITNLQLEFGSTKTDYSPYNGITKTISLGSTYYGGILNVDSGVLTVDRAIVDLSTAQILRNATNTTGYYRWQVIIDAPFAEPSSTNVAADIICNAYTAISASDTYVMRANGIALRQAGMFFIFDDAIATASQNDGVTYLQNLGIKVVGKLATPTTVQLTGEEITALLGENNVWCNSGDIEVTYRKGGA